MGVGSCGDQKLGSQMKAVKQCEVKQALRAGSVEISVLYEVLWPWLKRLAARGIPKVTHTQAYKLVRRAGEVAPLLKAKSPVQNIKQAVVKTQ